MENYKEVIKNLSEFTKSPKAFMSCFLVRCGHPGMQMKLKSQRNPLSISALLRYQYVNSLLSAQLMSQNNYKYKFLHKGQAIPLNFFGKFCYQGETLVKNSISIEYKHSKCNLTVKLTNHPMNLVFTSVAGEPQYGVHGKLKTNLRLNRVQKSVIGCYYSSHSLFTQLAYNILQSESTFLLQKTSNLGKISQYIQYNSKNSALIVHFGIDKPVWSGLAGIKLDSKGNLLVKYCTTVEECLQVEAGCNVDLSKSTGKTLVYSGGVRLNFNFYLPKEQ